MDSNNKHCTWTHNPNPVYTWEVKNNWQNTTVWPPNTVTATTIPGVTVASTSFQFPPPATNESMIDDIMNRTEDKGFFRDMVEWLEKEAPKRLPLMLRELCPPMHTGSVFYDRLCEVLYQIGFRTSEMLERRMILGPANKWVADYFKDFPSRQ